MTNLNSKKIALCHLNSQSSGKGQCSNRSQRKFSNKQLVAAAVRNDVLLLTKQFFKSLRNVKKFSKKNPIV